MFRTNRFITIQNANRLKTCDKLINPSSVTKDVPYINIYVLSLVYLPLLWWLETQFFLIKTDGWKDFMFRNEKFLSFEHPCNLFQYVENKGIDSNNNLWKRRNTNGSIKEQPFHSRGSKKLYSSHREKKIRYQYVKCLGFLGLCPPPCSQFYRGNWR